MRTFTPMVYVEDDPVARKSFRDDIGDRLGNRIDYLSSAEDLLARLTTPDPDRRLEPGIILVDLALPGISGYELVRTLRRDYKHLDMASIIVVTGSYTETAKVTAKAVGADWLLGKPVTRFSLLDAVHGIGRHELGIVARMKE